MLEIRPIFGRPKNIYWAKLPQNIFGYPFLRRRLPHVLEVMLPFRRDSADVGMDPTASISGMPRRSSRLARVEEVRL